MSPFTVTQTQIRNLIFNSAHRRKSRLAIVTATVSLFLIIFLASCAVFRFPQVRKSLRNSGILTTSYPVRFKFDLDQFIYIKVRLNNQPSEQKFLLDTGSPCTFCYNTIQSTGLKRKRLFHFRHIKFDYGSGSADLAGLKYNRLAYLVSDLFCTNHNHAGFFGANAMHHLIWQFNFQDTTITVSDTLTDFAHIDSGYQLNFKPAKDDQTPIVKLVINRNDTLTALIDTGNPETLLINSKINTDNLKKSCSECVRTSFYDPVSGADIRKSQKKVEYKYIKTTEFALGNLLLENIIVTQIPVKNYKNLLGMDFLKHFIVTIDWIHHQLYLQPLPTINQMKSKFTYGFTCTKRNGGVFVSKVFTHTAADSSGLKSEMKILKINGMDADNLSKTVLDQINNNLPSDQKMSVQFSDREITVRKQALFE